jgi:hypothetical protein
MAFWIAIAMGMILGYVYSRKGFYEAIILVFNLILSMYLALYLTPTLLAQAPSATDIPGGLALAVLILFSLCFGVLLAISFVLFTGQFTVPLARILDCLGGGFAGFFAGLGGTSFILLVLTLTPIPGIPEYAQNMEVTANTRIVCSACDGLNRWVGADRLYKTKELLVWLNEKALEKPAPMTDPNSVPNTTDPNTAE